MIESGKKVVINYTMKVDGQIVEQSDKGGSLEYVHGKGNIIKGLERQLEGLKVGDERIITIKPEEGYGDIKPNAERLVQKSDLPQDIKLQIGQVLKVRDEDGTTFPVTVAEVREDAIMLNLNHPLAGKELEFDVKVVEIS